MISRVSTTVALAILVSSAAAFAQPHDEQQLIKLESDWADAARRDDAEALGRILDDKFVSTDWDGQVQSREQYVASVAQSKVDSLKVEELMPHVWGDTAVVNGRERFKSTYRGKEESGDFRFTDVFVKRHGHWKAIATHESRIAP
jgi:ketosteroid isomerase-like protein